MIHSAYATDNLCQQLEVKKSSVSSSWSIRSWEQKCSGYRQLFPTYPLNKAVIFQRVCVCECVSGCPAAPLLLKCRLTQHENSGDYNTHQLCASVFLWSCSCRNMITASLTAVTGLRWEHLLNQDSSREFYLWEAPGLYYPSCLCTSVCFGFLKSTEPKQHRTGFEPSLSFSIYSQSCVCYVACKMCAVVVKTSRWHSTFPLFNSNPAANITVETLQCKRAYSSHGSALTSLRLQLSSCTQDTWTFLFLSPLGSCIHLCSSAAFLPKSTKSLKSLLTSGEKKKAESLTSVFFILFKVERGSGVSQSVPCDLFRKSKGAWVTSLCVTLFHSYSFSVSISPPLSIYFSFSD